MLSRVPWAKSILARIMKLRSTVRTPACHRWTEAGQAVILLARIAAAWRQHGFRYNRLFIKNQRTLWGRARR